MKYSGKHDFLILHSDLLDPVFDPSVVKKVDSISRADLVTLIASETTNRQSTQRQSTSSHSSKLKLVQRMRQRRDELKA